MPNTHRRRRRDATVELSRVVVGGVYTVQYSQLAHKSRRLPTDLVDILKAYKLITVCRNKMGKQTTGLDTPPDLMFIGVNAFQTLGGGGSPFPSCPSLFRRPSSPHLNPATRSGGAL